MSREEEADRQGSLARPRAMIDVPSKQARPKLPWIVSHTTRKFPLHRAGADAPFSAQNRAQTPIPNQGSSIMNPSSGTYALR
jgi:hypothetical protein